MSRSAYHDDDEEWVADDESEGELSACPACGASVHEDTQQCPHCGDWIIPINPADRTKRWVWTVAALLVVISMLGFVIF